MKLGRPLRKAAVLLSRKSMSGSLNPRLTEISLPVRAPISAEVSCRELPPMGTDMNLEINQSSTPSISCSQALPNELLHCILGYLVSSLYPHVFHYNVHLPALKYGRNVIDHMDIAWLHMLSAIQVCHAWHAVGTQLLYSTPMLISHRRIRLFAAALEKSPYLGEYVRDVFVLDQALRHPYENHTLEISSEAGIAIAYRLARTDLIRALRLCPSLRSLTISNRSDTYTSIHPIDNFFLSTSLSGSRLQKLVIYGSMAPAFPNFRPFMSEDASMPNLRILCLREVYFPDDFHFPHLPQLHTLRMAQCFLLHEDPHNESITISSDRLPSLRTLELYTNTFSVQLDDIGMRHLHRYHVFSYADFLSGQVDFATSTSLCHLALGPFAIGSDYFPDGKWRLPAALETLTICLDISGIFLHPPLAQPAMSKLFKSLCHSLGLNDPRQLLSPRKLTMMFHYRGSPALFNVAPTCEIATLCASRSIACEIITNVMADDWITERLTQGDFAP